MTDNAENKEIIYKMTLEHDKSIKQFFDRFYVIPKEEYTAEQIEFLKQNAVHPTYDEVKEGRNGFIVFRGRKKKILTEDKCREIRESNLTQMKLSEIYGVSIGTINKVKNNKY